nr:uncharacterized protein LOC106686443 isoform X2 [Halyomorpha halys]
MFSFASKMLNTLMGEGEGAPPPRPPAQIRPTYHQQGPRLQQMTYPRPTTTHLAPQSVLRGPEEPNLDLSHLSAEERALIQNVMAKAKDLDKTQKPAVPDSNQFRGLKNPRDDTRQHFPVQSGSYPNQQNLSYHQENFQQQNLLQNQDSYHQPSSSFQKIPESFQHNEDLQYSNENFQLQQDSFQNITSNINQHYDNYQLKQEIQSLQENFSSMQRKDYPLQRQDSYNSQKQSSPYFHNTCWENGEKDDIGRPGNIQQPDCEYSTPSPVSNSPDIRLSPSSPPASPSSEDNRTSLLATSKDEMKPQLPMESFYDHSPGEVYTIPEEEDEISSPTSDGVTSLRKRRLVGAQNVHQEDGPKLQSAMQSNNYRSNNNFNVMNQNTIKSTTSYNQIGNESEKVNGNSLPNQSCFTNMSMRQNQYSNESKIGSIVGENRLQSFLDKHSERNIQGQLGSNTSEMGDKQAESSSSQLHAEQIKQQLSHSGQQSQVTSQIHQSNQQVNQLQQNQSMSPVTQQQHIDIVQHLSQIQQQNQIEKNQQLHMAQNVQQQNQQIQIQQQQQQNQQMQIQQQQNQQMQIQQQQNQQMQIQQQQQLHRQQEIQYMQMKKFQHLQRQQIHSRPNSRSPLSQQNKQNIENAFQMKSEAGFYQHEDSWRNYGEFPDEMNAQFYGKDYAFEQQIMNQQKCRDHVFGFQNDLESENMNVPKAPSQQNNTSGKTSAGTISGMLADFSRALGLSNISDEKNQDDSNTLNTENKDITQSQSSKPMSQQQIQAQIRSNEQFIHGNQNQNTMDFQGQQHGQISMENKHVMRNDEIKMQTSRPNPFQTAQQYQLQQQQLQLDYNQIQHPSLQVQVFAQPNLMQQKHGLVKDEFLNSIERDQKAVYLQQQIFQKLPEQQPMFAQNLTPQQQQMYQQHMQLQHHAQHLKKIKRSLPHSSNEQQRQQPQKKDGSVNMIGQNQNIGTGVTIQQMIAAQFLSQQSSLPIQIMNSQLVGSDMKLPTQNRMVAANSPVLVASGLTNQQLNSVTPMGTPQSTPVGTPRGTRDGGDSSDTMSETDSQKSLRTRRKLPSIPSDQEAITLPNTKKRDRVKPKSPHDKFSRSYSPLRQFSDGGYRVSSSNLMLHRPSSSETNLRKISNFGPETIPRPGSALGLLQGSSVVSSSGMHVDYNRDSELASCLPPDLRYLLHSYKSTTDIPYTKQQFIQAYKEHLGSDVKMSMADRRTLNRMSNIDWETERLLSRNKDLLRNPKSRLDIQRKIAYSGIGRTRKLRTHRRQLSDPKIHLEMSPLKDCSEGHYNRGYYGVVHPSLRPPYKSFEYESIDDGKLSEWDTSHPYLASYAIAGGALRETAINSVLDKDHMNSDQIRYDMRRYSDSLDIRHRDVSKHHKPRSWQPSPYGSDEEDDTLSREQKKAKIKAEIARRRQQIEENARLHEELLRLARLRESAELGYAPLGNTPTLSGDYAMSSVLKSIDDLIGRESDYAYHRTPEDRSMDRIASTFRTDDYTSGVYERLTDFSPVTDFSTPHAMPLLPDMPTRSRKLLEDLGSSPITESVLTLPQKGT